MLRPSRRWASRSSCKSSTATPATWLRARSPSSRPASKTSVPGVSAELMQSMIEVKTGICTDRRRGRDTNLLPMLAARAQHRQLARLRTGDGRHASVSSHQHQRRLSRRALRTHPGPPGLADVSARHVRPARSRRRARRATWPSASSTCSCSTCRTCWPLSANSPFWQGVDTGLASCRSPCIACCRTPGVPLAFPRLERLPQLLPGDEGLQGDQCPSRTSTGTSARGPTSAPSSSASATCRRRSPRRCAWSP